MDVKDLNKSQLILLAILLSFVTSIATGITTVTLMQQAPPSVTMPITRIVRETVEKVVPVKTAEVLSPDQKKLLEDLKAIKPLTVNLFSRVAGKDKLVATGLFLGDNRVVIASIIAEPKEGEEYVVKSVLGEQKVSKVVPDKDFTIIELTKTEIAPPASDTDNPATPLDVPPAGTPISETPIAQ